MATLITSQTDQALTLTISQPLDCNPAAVYLASLSETGRRTQKQADTNLGNS